MRETRSGAGRDARAGRGTRAARAAGAVLAVAGATTAVRALVLVPVVVTGSSMEPTVHDGDVALVLRAGTAVDRLDRGDLVVLRDPAGDLALKRVVGLPGDRVAMLDARLVVDGIPVDEPYVDHATIDGTYLAEVTVPAGTVYVLGDDRARSVDSREHGPVAGSDLLGRVLVHW
jgi:signal peptidase I